MTLGLPADLEDVGAVLAVANACVTRSGQAALALVPLGSYARLCGFFGRGRDCPVRSWRAVTRSLIPGRLAHELCMPSTPASGRRADGGW